MITFKKAEPGDIWLIHKQTWRPGKLTSGAVTVTASCPKCGRGCSLSQHAISASGEVTPSVVCPFGDCDFHDYIKLEDWNV